MKKVDILKLLDGKWEDGTRPKDLFAQHISKAPKEYVEVLLAGLHSDNRKVQNGCAELCALLSENHPALLYGHIAAFQKNLTTKEPIWRWEAACALGHLAAVDDNGSTRSSVPLLIGYLRDKSIVLQGHCVRALTRIVRKFPDLGPEVLDAFITNQSAFPGNRVGFVVEAMAVFLPNPALLPKVIAFVEPYTRSDIGSVATKARKVMKNVPSFNKTPAAKAKKPAARL